MGVGDLAKYQVSIPERVLGWLKHGEFEQTPKGHLFQSLKGF